MRTPPGPVPQPLTRDLLLRRILRKVTLNLSTGCWLYRGAHSQSGYRGVFYPCVRLGSRSDGTRRVWRLNRLMAMLYHGPADLPQRTEEPFLGWLERLRVYYQGMDASHGCDHAGCINPEHLSFAGHRANVQEQQERKRVKQERAERVKQEGQVA